MEIDYDKLQLTEDEKEKRQLSFQLPSSVVVLTDQISNQEIDELKILSALFKK